MVECGFNGNIPENFDGGPAPQENQGGADTSKGKPNASVFSESPQENSDIYIISKKGTSVGVKYPTLDDHGEVTGWGVTDNNFVDGSYDHTFRTEEEANAYIKNNDMLVRAKAANISNIDSKKPFTGGFLTKNSYMAASDAEKFVAHKITELVGNNWVGGKNTARFTQLNTLGKAAESAKILDEAAKTGKSLDQILAEQPDETLGKTVAGRILNTSRYIRQYIYNKYDPLRLINPGKTGTTDDYARFMERSLQQANAQAKGPFSPMVTAENALKGILRNNKLDFNIFERYMLANHTLERIAMMQKQFDAINDAIPKAKTVSEKNRLLRELEEFKVGTNYENPTAFSYTFKDAKGQNVTLKGKEGVNAFLGSIPEDVSKQYEKAAQVLKRFTIDVIERMRAANLITGDQYENYKSMNYYMPLRQLEENGSRFESQLPSHIIGRSTEAENPVGQLFKFLEDGVYRAHANILYKNVVNDLLALKNPNIGFVGYAELEPTRDGLSYRVKNLDQNTLYVVNHGEHKPEIIAFKFNTDTNIGKRCAEALGKYGQLNARADTFLHAVSGFTRWTSMLATIYHPAMFTNNVFWNMGLGIAASQQAFNLESRAVPGFLSKLYPNIGKTVIDYFKDSQNRNAAFKLFENIGGGTSRYNVWDIANSSKDLELSLKPVSTNLREQPFETAKYGLRRTSKAITHFSHTPDVALQAAAFKTYLEHVSGRSWSDPGSYNDLYNYAINNREVINQALDGSRRMLPNFAQVGSQTMFTSFYPFFNAAVQTLPFVWNIAKTPWGAASLSMALVAGYFGEKTLFGDYGEKANDVDKAHKGFYIGNGNVIPADYAYRLPIEIGAALYRVMEKNEEPLEASMSLVRPTMDLLTPMLPPSGASNGPSWVMALTPSAIKPFVAVGFGINNFGQSVDADNPIDPATGSKILNPHPSDYAKPSTPSWAVQVSQAMENVPVIGQAMFPGRIAELARDLFSPGPNLYDAFSGSGAALHGKEQSTETILRSIFAPSTEADPNMFAPIQKFESQMKQILDREGGGSAITTKSLLTNNNPKIREVLELEAEIKRKERALYVTDENGQSYKRSDLVHQITMASGKGDNETANKYRRMLFNIQNQADEIYSDGLNRLQSIQK